MVEAEARETAEGSSFISGGTISRPHGAPEVTALSMTPIT
jgi:hypothetical protein